MGLGLFRRPREADFFVEAAESEHPHFEGDITTAREGFLTAMRDSPVPPSERRSLREQWADAGSELAGARRGLREFHDGAKGEIARAVERLAAAHLTFHSAQERLISAAATPETDGLTDEIISLTDFADEFARRVSLHWRDDDAR